MLPVLLPRSAFSRRALWVCSRVALLAIVLGGLAVPGLAQTAHFGSAARTVVRGLFSPFGVAVDLAGDLYVTDSGNNRVVKYVPSAGSYTQNTVFDASIPCGSATPCGLATPYGVAVDTSGDVFIADLGNNRVVKETLSEGSYTQSTVAAASQPNAVAVDSGGNVYIASTGNNQVLVEMPVGGSYTSLTTITGLNSPKGLAVDASGVVYVADTGNNRVVKETPGTGGFYFPSIVASTSATYDYPFGVAVDAKGVVYYTDHNSGTSSSEVVRATPAGGSYHVAVVAGGGTAPFGYGMALDTAGNLFVAGAGGGNVVQLKLTGANLLTQAVTSTSGIQPLSFAFDTGGVLGSYQVLTQGAAGLDFTDAGGGTCTAGTTYNAGAVCMVIVAFTPQSPGLRQGAVTLQNSSGVVIATGYLQGVGTGPQVGFTPGRISTVAGNGTQCPSSTARCGDGNGATSANLWNPAGVVADAAGNLYLADADDNRIRKVMPGGTISTIAGTGATGGAIGDGGAATSAQLYYPNGVAIDGAGNLYIADTFHHRIRRVDAATNIITTVAGTGTLGSSGDGGAATGATLHDPYGVAVDGAGNLYIADTLNDEIRKVTAATGIITTVAGTHVQGFNGDGGPATGANLYQPHGVTFDSSGNLLIADTSDQRIRRVDAVTGMISTVAGNGSTGFAGDGSAATSAGFVNPTSVAADVAGNLYIADQGDDRIRRVSVASGILSTVVGTGADASTGDGGAASNGTVAGPSGLALDGAGNLYSADFDTHRIRRITAAANPLTFAATTLGNTSSDSPQTVTLNNIGNADLSLAVPSATGNRNPSVSTGFAYGSGSTCPQLSSASSPFVLAAGASCTEFLSFAPQTAGTYSGVSVSVDDALNVAGATQPVPLAGTATQATPSVAVASSSIPYGTASTTLTATITFSGVADTGAVTFAVDSRLAIAGACSASGTYTASCTASYNTAGLTGGTHIISATVAADANYVTASGTAALTVGKVSPAVTISSASTVYGSASTTLTASVAYTGAAAPTGGLSFTVDGVTALAASCTGTASPLTCLATFSTASLAGGSHTVLAATAADANYTAAASGLATLTVTPVAPGLALGAVSIPYGTTSVALTATLTYSGAAAPTGPVTFSVDGGTPLAGTCTGLSSPLLCSVSDPSSSLIAGAHTVTVAVEADANYTVYSRGGPALTITRATPVLTWPAPAPISYGAALTAAQLDATASVPGSFVYAPTFGAVPPLGTQTLSITFTPADTTDYTATTRTVPLTVNPSAPVCSLSVQGTSTALTVLAVGSCTDPQGQPLTTTLDWGDKTTTPVSAPRNVHTYATAGTYTVVLTATDTSSQTGKAQQRITPNQLPVCTLGSIQASSATPNAGTETVSYVFRVTASCTDPQGQALTATIDWGDGTTQPALANGVNSHPYADPASTKTYNVVLTATDGAGLSGTATQSVIVVPAPTSTPGTPTTVSATIAPQPSSVSTAQLTVTFLCSSVLAPGSTTAALPAQYGISCSSPPQPVLTTAPIVANVTINSTAATITASSAVPNQPLAWCVLLFPGPALGFFALGAGARGRRRRFHALGVLLLVCLTLTSCGGSFIPPPIVATPTGTYFITVTEAAACSSASGAACPSLPTGFVQTSLIVPLTIHP